jgi:chromosome segregation ATPase
MMGIIEWLVLISTISTLSFSWAVYLINLHNSKNLPEKIKEDEERLIQLMGRVRIFVDSKIEILEVKMKELNDLISQVNDLYSKLVLEVSEYQKNIKTNSKISYEEKKEVEANSENFEKTLEETIEKRETKKTEMTREEQIIELYNQGVEEAEIAKKFGMGIGEVRLIIDLFHRTKSK